MNRSLVFATNNENKVKEIRSSAPAFNIIPLKEAGIDIDIPEPHNTLEANATEKSRTIHSLTKQDCFSEDTGLEVPALNGEPGVKSARYAGNHASNDANIMKLLKKLEGIKERAAQFRTVISLIIDDKEYFFEGICKGTITDKRTGTDGFGYDPVFIPEGSNVTFAEMSMQQKNEFSHRKKALTKLLDFLNSYDAKSKN